MLVTVTELPEFIRRAEQLFSEAERMALIGFLSAKPRSGEIMVGTGGIRKLRWASGNRGKSSANRVIYYYHNERFPLYVLTVFAKSERSNLSHADRNKLASLVMQLIHIE